MNHFGRAFCSRVPLIVLVARGAQNKFLFAVVILDLLFVASVAHLAQCTIISQPVYSKLAELPEGDVVILPASGPNIHPQNLWEQRFHGRKVWLSPNRLGLPPALMAIPEIRQLADNPNDFQIETETFPCFIPAF